LSKVIELISLTLDQRHFQRAATALATKLAVELACTRVGIGFLRGRFVTVRALSHSASHGVKTRLVRGIAAAMEEAIDQDAVVACPGKGTVNIAHRKLMERNRDTAVCTIPLADDGRIIGAITFERDSGPPFDAATVDLYTHVANFVGPILELKRRNDTWPVVRLLQSSVGLLHRLFGPRHLTLKLGALLLSLTLGVLMVAGGSYRVTAGASLQGAIQRAIVAPVDGYILDTDVRPGDLVEAGQVLGSLDDRELKLEQQKLTSEKARYAREYRNALAGHDRAQVSILDARIAQSEAQLQLIDRQLERMQITTPLDGVIVSGDLSQSLGSPVARGDVLFEVAPLASYRLVLRVDERDVGDVATGQRGSLKLAGLPGDALAFEVSRVTPVSEPEADGNYFHVEARLMNAPALLRPGMEGVGKIEIGERRLLWIWTHRLIDWVKLKAWSWLP
jgi:RND family efflux transporter MFP subunit